MQRSRPSSSPRLLGGIALCLLGAFSTGCYSKATGREGALTFAYASGTDIDNFVKPIASGAKLEIVAFTNGTEDELALTKVTSSRPQVLAIVSVEDRKLVVRGGEPGVAELTITARDPAGKILTDTMFFHVAKPAVHRLEHACTEDASAAYVKGAPLDIYHALATSDRRAVIGYDYAPLTVEPKDALELVAQPQGSPIYRFVARSAAPRVTVRSGIDQRVLTLRVVERGDLEDVTLANAQRMIVGETAYAVAWVQLEGATLCSQNARTKARSLTPDICSVTAKLDDEPGEDENHDQLADVTALAFGTCRFEVTLPELASGRGVTRTGTIAIGRTEFPGEERTSTARVLGRDLHGWPYLAAWWLGSNALVLLAGVLGFVGARRRTRESSRSDRG